jgi:hypothetical protein
MSRLCQRELLCCPASAASLLSISILFQILRKLEEQEIDLNHLQDMPEKEIGAMIRYAPGGRVNSILVVLIFV